MRQKFDMRENKLCPDNTSSTYCHSNYPVSDLFEYAVLARSNIFQEGKINKIGKNNGKHKTINTTKRSSYSISLSF